jgi:DNA mismatch repair protein MutS2
MYGYEAIEALDKFIDNAILNNLQRIDVIHGKGTGALRKKIEEYLKKLDTIKSFRLGEWNEGGTGITIVELK